MERAEKDQIERVINRTMKERFGLETAERAVLLEHGDHPAIEAGQLMVRVFVPAPDAPAPDPTLRESRWRTTAR